MMDNSKERTFDCVKMGGLAAKQEHVRSRISKLTGKT